MMAYSASPSRLPINTIQNPFTYSINPQLSDSLQPYNFHEHSLGNSPPQQRGPNNPRREANFTENLNLMDNQSFARNFKSRLYGADPTEEVAKQLKQQKYREELLFQAEENRRKKQM
jgi:nitrate reductase beta subunit